ncbi:MAG: UDP-N-acetylmuramoyl-L-alanyl-D-glutamate--2,6-diaminopimelate ligase [Sulfuricellaceae bacterium]|nr:UDP-N-acetylmuramoyl-L-alanyl-D-glutamate--2,6-diaminopimelate ligase [Sulfuricellaceae bacterium]
MSAATIKQTDTPFSGAEILRSLGVRVKRLVADSRQIRAGDTFVAYPGASQDGRQYIGQAIAAGANAVLWEKAGFVPDSGWPVANLGVTGLREQIGAIADIVYGHPSQALWMIGVTGTNGKTSCSHWLAGALTACGRKTAVIGTLGNGFLGGLAPAVNTTPDAIGVHQSLADYLNQGAACVAMEVSSHGLAQGRVAGVAFDVALLTNLSRDHLDYHGDMESYGAAKSQLFKQPGLRYAVLNLDDGFGAELAQQLAAGGVQVVGYTLEGSRIDCDIRIEAESVRVSEAGLEFEAVTPWGRAELKSGLLGRFNAANLLGALAVLLVSGIPLQQAADALAQVPPAAGRLQRLGGGDRPLVVVDYAHTPDALEKVLHTLRETLAGTDARLICVFGCGGDRDRGKRPLMGAVASRLADAAIVTDDNPRGEDALEIIAEIVSGMDGREQIIADRAEAIASAITAARPGDIVLIAGKGHEEYQEIGGIKYPFSDVLTAQHALQHYGENPA